MKRLVMLGGGPTHLQALAAMAREPLPGVQAVLAAPHARHIHRGMVPGWVAGHYTLDECTIALEPLARAAKVELALSTAVSVDAAQRTVTLADGRIAEYDVLSIDTEAGIHRDAVPGAREQGLFVRPLEHFVQLFDRVPALAAERVLDVVVVGGGPCGFELALAVHHRLNGAGSERARVCLVSGDATVLPGCSPRVHRLAVHTLRRARITLLNQRVVEIGASHVQLDNGARLVCDVPLLALPATPPPWLQRSGLALDEQGLVCTTGTLQSPSHPEVFAVGDVAVRSDRTPVGPGLAARAGAALALNLRRKLAGGELEPWRPRAHVLQLLSCGERRAIAAWGNFALQARWAWWLKDQIDRGFVGSLAPVPSAVAATRDKPAA